MWHMKSRVAEIGVISVFENVIVYVYYKPLLFILGHMLFLNCSIVEYIEEL